MSIPDYQTLMLPLLRHVDGASQSTAPAASKALSDEFDLSPEERAELLPSGKSTVIRSRVGWARTYLRKAGLLESPQRGIFRITERGREALTGAVDRIDNKFLERYPEFVEFKAKRADPKPASALAGGEGSGTPEETFERAHARLKRSLEADLLDQVMAGSPEFFEQLVVALLVKMGYGGSLSDAGQAVGRSGDGGIDGTIKEDRLGLDVIYIQAKKWENTVGRPEIQKFAGALQGRRARKGVFITTSKYSKEALGFVKDIEASIVLIDGQLLAQLMVEHDVGVTAVGKYELKKIDLDYFEED